MPSPFPGMDPYIEGPIWSSFHGPFATELGRQLNRQLPPGYAARVERTMMTDDTITIETRAGRRWPDISVVRDPGSSAYGAVLAKPPLEIEAIRWETSPHYTVRVVRDRDHELVTAIEVLSPANKRGEGFAEYKTKRNEYLNSPVHLIEIDLLRAGERVPMAQALPNDPYFVLVHRVETRPLAGVWPIPLSDPLPKIPVPLRGDSPEPVMDLQHAFATVYADFRFEFDIDYSVDPPVALTEQEAIWVDRLLRAAGLRHGRDPAPDHE